MQATASPEPYPSAYAYGPCQAPRCTSDRGRLYPGGRFCPDHKPQPRTTGAAR